MPDLSNIHIDTALTNISIAYTNQAYVANEVFPTVPVPKRSDKYFLYNKDSFLRSSGKDAQGKPSSIRRPGSRSTEIIYDVSTNSYYCEQLAKSYALTDPEVNYADNPLSPAIDVTMSLTDMITLDNEIAVAAKAMKRANFASANKVQLANGSTSWAAATGKPISVDIPNGKLAVIKGIVRPANRILMNYAAAVTLSQNAEYLGDIKYVSKDAVTMAGLPAMLNGLKVVEAYPQYATSGEGVTAVTSGYVWVDDQATPQDAALIYYVPPAQPALRMVTFGATFEAPDDSLHAQGFVIKRWREEWRDAELIECRTTRDWRFLCTDGSSNGDGSNGYATGGYLVSGTTL